MKEDKLDNYKQEEWDNVSRNLQKTLEGVFNRMHDMKPQDRHALLMEHLEEIIFNLSWDEVLLVPDNMKLGSDNT